jgi:predicted RNase H-like HicB family nuclease
MIRILHHHEPGYGWGFESPDIPGMIGGTESYDEKHAEEAAMFTLECLAKEQGLPVPSKPEFVHYVPAHAAVTA